MALLADDRAQSIQVGAVLLFAILILAFSTYQAVIVPDQNRQVEFDHNQDVQSQLGELRDRIMGSQDGGAARSTTVDLGTRYPSRAIALNPSPPSGSVRTVGTTDPLVNLTIDNAVANGETGDYWNGEPHHYNTGGIAYEPVYHNYDDAPTTGYEHTVLYNDFDADSLVLANQSFIEGTEISLVTINGSLERTSSTATTVDTRPLSGSKRTIQIDDDSGDPITLNFTSRLSEDRWQSILSDQAYVENVTRFPSAAGEEFDAIRVTLNESQTYELQLTKAGVGTGLSGKDPAYLTDVVGDDSSVARGNSRRIALEVRDRYNNPVRGVTVNGSVESGGTLASPSSPDGRETTDSDGRVTFTYRTTGSTATGTHAVNFTTADDSVLQATPFDRGAATNATVEVSVTASAGGWPGAYTLAWTDPGAEADNSGDALSDCDAESCMWDVGASDDDTLILNATLKPDYEGINVEYAVDETSVGSLSPGEGETNSGGANQTTVNARDDGTIEVLGSASEDSDAIEIQLINVTSSTLPPQPSFDYVRDRSSDCDRNPAGQCGDTEPTVEFDVGWTVNDPSGDLTDVTVELVDPNENVVDSEPYTYGGTGSVSSTVTLVDTPGQWESDYTTRLTATDDAGNTQTITQTEPADGIDDF